MEKLDYYTEAKFPIPPLVDGYYFPCYPNATQYSAADTSGAEGVVNNAFDQFDSELNDIKQVIHNFLDDIDTEWGTKFISLNGESLGIIHVDKFDEYFQKIIDSVDFMREYSTTFCSNVTEETATINGILSTLDANYQEYLTELNKYNNGTRDDDPTAFADILPDLDGQWVVGK